MAEKKGKGGHGLESFDPETGRYIAEDLDETGLPKYHAGTHFSVAEIEKMITDGYYGDDIKDYYNNLDDEKKDDMIGYFQQKLDNFFTEQKLEGQKQFTNLSVDEYIAAAQDCDSKTTQQDRDYFHHGYKGAGQKSFEFNKFLRFGADEYLKRFGKNKLAQVGLTVQEIEARAKAFDTLTNSFEAPRDMQVFRYDETGPITSYFRSTGVLDGLPIITNQYGYDQIDPVNLDLQDLANRLSRLVGSVVPRDGAYRSFSCIPEWTHMGKDENKVILTRFNVPKGKKCFISNYQYESEGLFPQDTQFIIQDVKKEQIEVTDRAGNKYLTDKVVLYYGVK